MSDEKLGASSFTPFEEMAAMAYFNSRSKGFWDEPRNKGEMIALIHSEVSELLEGIRKPAQSDHIPTYTLEQEECADIIIRVMDYFNGHFPEIALADVMIAKMNYNSTRPHKHGKVF